MDQIVADPASETLDEFGVKLGEMGRLWRTQMHRRLKSVGLGYMQWSALRYLAQVGDGCVQKDLAVALGIEGPTMVGVLDRLVAMDLVKRREAQHDRRFKTVHLAPTAHDLLDRAENELRGLRAEMLRDVPEADIKTCIRVFEAMAEQAEVL